MIHPVYIYFFTTYLQPGKTEKHVIFILPRENSVGDNMAMVSEVLDISAPTGSTGYLSNVQDMSHMSMTRVYSFGGNRSKSNLCLSHAAKERGTLIKKISDIKLQEQVSDIKLQEQVSDIISYRNRSVI